MNKKWLIAGGIMLLLVLSGLSVGNTIRLNHSVMKSWMQLEGEYERRSDLIPNLAVLVPENDENLSGAAAEMAGYRLAAINNRRLIIPREPGYAGAVRSRLNTRFVLGSAHFLRDTTRFTSFFDAQSGISGAASRLISAAAVSGEPETGDSFGNVVRLLERTENRIDRSVRQFSNSARNYNRSVTSFPGRLYSEWFGLHPVLGIADTTSSE